MFPVFEIGLDDFVFTSGTLHGQVSYSSACLSDALQQLPEHFCMLPSKEYLTAGIAGLITYFQWKRVLVINQEYSTFTFVSAPSVKFTSTHAYVILIYPDEVNVWYHYRTLAHFSQCWSQGIQVSLLVK